MNHVTGFEAMRARWQASAQTLHEVVDDALIAGADKVVSSAKFLVPIESGKLRSTIGHTGVLTSKKGNPYVVISAGDASTMVNSQRGPVQLARIIEFGTQKRSAEPFLRPAMRQNAASVRAGIRKAMRAAIKVANGM